MFLETINRSRVGQGFVSRDGIGSGRDLFPETPAETRVGMYRARYSYYLGLVAGTRLHVLSTQAEIVKFHNVMVASDRKARLGLASYPGCSLLNGLITRLGWG